MLASRMGMERTVVFDQRRVLGDCWETGCVSRSIAYGEGEMGSLLLLWPAILMVLGAHDRSSLLVRNNGQVEVNLKHTTLSRGNFNRSLATHG